MGTSKGPLFLNSRPLKKTLPVHQVCDFPMATESRGSPCSLFSGETSPVAGAVFNKPLPKQNCQILGRFLMDCFWQRSLENLTTWFHSILSSSCCVIAYIWSWSIRTTKKPPSNPVRWRRTRSTNLAFAGQFCEGKEHMLIDVDHSFKWLWVKTWYPRYSTLK